MPVEGEYKHEFRSVAHYMSVNVVACKLFTPCPLCDARAMLCEHCDTMTPVVGGPP